MFEQIILGIIQGVTEWLPISSEGIIVLVVKNFFGQDRELEEIIRTALFLHLGTFLAALIYFRKDVWSLIKALFSDNLGDNLGAWRPKFFGRLAPKYETKKVLNFLIIATIISGLLGFILLKIFVGVEEQIQFSAKLITLMIGLLLLITGGLQIKAKKDGYKKAAQIENKDGLLLGLLQGLAALPGLSRSGLTISGLLLRKFDNYSALKLSFLMSLPIVLGGNIILNFGHFEFLAEAIWGLIFSFIFGLLTIDLLLKIARKINFGYFAFVFGILVIISVII